MRTPTKKLMPAATLAITGLVTVGLLSLQSGAAAEDAKREDDATELALTSDDDSDDTNDDTGGNTGGDTTGDDTGDNTGTGISRSTNDNTNSRFTGVSRDRDISRSDKTRDWTREGGTRSRDHSANQTNDRSRSDTR